MPNLNASSQNYTHLILNVSVKEPQNVVRKLFANEIIDLQNLMTN